jgi:hypothetical protein
MSTRKIITAERVPTSPAPEEKAVAPAKKQEAGLTIYTSAADIEKRLEGTEKLKAINLKITSYVEGIQKITVKDDTSAKALDTLVSEAKKYAKQLKEEGEGAREKYNVASKAIKAFYDGLTEKLVDLTAAGQKKIVDYLAEEKRKQEKEAALRNKQQMELQSWINDAIKAIWGAFTKEEMSEVHTQFIKPFKVEDYPLLTDEVITQALAGVKAAGKSRIDGIKSGEIKRVEESGDPLDEENEEPEGLSTDEAIEQVQAAMSQAAISAPVVATPTVKLSTSVRRTIAFKLWKGEPEVDIKFKSVDEKKVKAFIYMEREKIKKNLDAPGVTQGYVAGGILFYYEEGATTR